MISDPREETLQLLNDNIKSRVIAETNISTKPEHKWRDVPDHIRRLLTAIPSEEPELIRELQHYCEMISTVAPFVVKAAYTHDLPLQTMRQHLGTILEKYSIPWQNTKCWTIDNPWHRQVVEIFHNLRYNAQTVEWAKRTLYCRY
jgi:hypothetical protein